MHPTEWKEIYGAIFPGFQVYGRLLYIVDNYVKRTIGRCYVYRESSNFLRPNH